MAQTYTVEITLEGILNRSNPYQIELGGRRINLIENAAGKYYREFNDFEPLPSEQYNKIFVKVSCGKEEQWSLGFKIDNRDYYIPNFDTNPATGHSSFHFEGYLSDHPVKLPKDT